MRETERLKLKLKAMAAYYEWLYAEAKYIQASDPHTFWELTGRLNRLSDKVSALCLKLEIMIAHEAKEDAHQKRIATDEDLDLAFLRTKFGRRMKNKGNGP